MEKYETYLGVRDVAIEIRPYKTRTAFTNLTSSPPTIYLNEYLIDDEEILEYLILRELIHISLHMYPSMRYTGGLSYAVTAFSTFSYQRRRSKRLSLFFPLPLVYIIPPEEPSAEPGKKAEEKKEVIEASGSPLYQLFHLFPYPPAGTSSQELAHRYN